MPHCSWELVGEGGIREISTPDDVHRGGLGYVWTVRSDHPASPCWGQHILQAGGIGKCKVIEQLERIAPVTVVSGNVNGFEACGFPAEQVIELAEHGSLSTIVFSKEDG